MNPYEVLLVKADASRGEIDEAYRDLVKVWHPDRFVNDERLQRVAQDRLSQINQAYQILTAAARAPEQPAPETVVPPITRSAPAAQPPPQLPLTLIMAASTALVVLIVTVRIYLFLQAPMNALPTFTDDAHRVATWGGPSIVDAFQGWNGLLPSGMRRLLDSYQTPAASPGADVSRGQAAPAPNVSNRPGTGRLRPGFGEIHIQNRTGEKLQISLLTTRTQAVLVRPHALEADDDMKLGGLGPDIYAVNVTFQDARRRPLRLGPFMMVEVQSGSGVQADQYEVVLKPPTR